MGYDRLYIKKKKVLEPEEDTSLMDESQKTRSRLKRRKRLYGDRQRETLSRLAIFQQTLRSKQGRVNALSKQNEESSVNVELPAAWRVDDYLKNIERIGVSDLLAHRLEFDHAKKDSMSRDMHSLDDYIVIDSRDEEKKDQAVNKWTGRPNL